MYNNKSIKTFRLLITTGLIAMLSGAINTAMAIGRTVTNYNNIFISYASPKYVNTVATFVKTNQLGGAFFWPISGDLAPSDPQSLLATLAAANTDKEPYQIGGYWENWSVYQTDPAKAIQRPNYPISGSLLADGTTIASNPAFDAQITKLDILNYAFLEAQTLTQNDGSNIGRIYFDDPTADLLPNDATCQKDEVLKSVCGFITAKAKMGNFEAFAKLPHVKRVISIGGYGHDNVFDDMLGNTTYQQNFITSAQEIINNFGIDGIDLDYESVTMTTAQADQYTQLIVQLRKALPNAFISVTLLAGPSHLTQFSSNDLTFIYQNASRINLMTYDFHGAFDGATGYTGLLTNVYPDNADPNINKFSIQESVKTLAGILDNGGTSSLQKVMLGIPAYGRAFDNVTIASNNGLYQSLANAAIPRGNDDLSTCTTQWPLTASSCSGVFDYNYIVTTILQNDLSNQHDITTLDPQGRSIVNGTIGDLASWTQISRTNQVLATYIDATEMDYRGDSQNWFVNFKHAYPGPLASRPSANILLLGFATFDSDGNLKAPGGNFNWADIDPNSAAYNNYMPDHTAFKDLGGKVLLSIGGATVQPSQWANLNHAQLDSMVSQIQYIANIDGIDLDAEYPSADDQTVAQANNNLTYLILALRKAYPNMLIVSAVYPIFTEYCPEKSCSSSPYANQAVLDALDYIFVMNYNLGTTDYDKFKNSWIQNNVPASEMIYGIQIKDQTTNQGDPVVACHLASNLQTQGYAGSFLWAISNEQEINTMVGNSAYNFLAKMNAGLQSWGC